MKENMKWYWYQKHQQKIIVIPTCTILHPCLDVILVKCIQDIPRSFCNWNQANQDLQIIPICVTDSNHDYIIDEILRWYRIDHEIKINIEDTAE